MLKVMFFVPFSLLSYLIILLRLISRNGIVGSGGMHVQTFDTFSRLLSGYVVLIKLLSVYMESAPFLTFLPASSNIRKISHCFRLLFLFLFFLKWGQTSVLMYLAVWILETADPFLTILFFTLSKYTFILPYQDCLLSICIWAFIFPTSFLLVWEPNLHIAL